jgi:hypothetical protein
MIVAARKRSNLFLARETFTPYYGPHLGQLLWGVTGFPRAARMRLINGFRKTQVFRWTLKLFH